MLYESCREGERTNENRDTHTTRHRLNVAVLSSSRLSNLLTSSRLSFGVHLDITRACGLLRSLLRTERTISNNGTARPLSVAASGGSVLPHGAQDDHRPAACKSSSSSGGQARVRATAGMTSTPSFGDTKILRHSAGARALHGWRTIHGIPPTCIPPRARSRASSDGRVQRHSPNTARVAFNRFIARR